MKIYNFLTLPSKLWSLILRVVLYFPVIPYAALFIASYIVDGLLQKGNTPWGPWVPFLLGVVLSVCGIALSVIAIIRFVKHANKKKKYQ